MEIKTLPLSFCSQIAHNVVNNESKELIIKKIKKYEIDINHKRAYILNNKSIYFLEKTQHIISIKSSGTNYYLFLTNINNINYCFYIDRKIKDGYTYPRIISVKYSFDDIIFKDTLIDGELVKHKENPNEWMFLISDLMILNGEKINYNIIKRFNNLYEILKNNYKVNKDIDICPLVVKKLFLYKDYDYLITQFIPCLKYKTNGLYFNSLNTKHANQLYIFNKTTNSQIKDKKFNKIVNNSNKFGKSDNINKNTFKILKIKKTDKPDVYNLFCKNRNSEYKYGIACISKLNISKFVKQILKEKLYAYVNCQYNINFKKYEPISLSSIYNDSDLSEYNTLVNH